MVHTLVTQDTTFPPIDQLSVLHAKVCLVIAFVTSIHNIFYFSSKNASI